MRLLFLVVLMAAVSGCAQLAPAKDAVISGVQKYCGLKQADRGQLRKAVNDGLAGAATICVQCAGDSPDSTCAAPPAPAK